MSTIASPIICPTCGQPNAVGRTTCWHCRYSLVPRKPANPNTGKWIAISIVVFVLLVMLIGILTPSDPTESDWELIGNFGGVRTIYVQESRILDPPTLERINAEVLEAVDTGLPLQVDYFDDRDYTPVRYPMTDEQLKHWKAQCNVYEGKANLKYVTVDPKNIPPAP